MENCTRNEAEGHLPAIQQPCGFARRLGAIAYDSLLLFGILMIAAALFMAVFGEHATQPNHPFYTLYLSAISLCFFVGFWTHGGQTLGMRAWGVRVVTLDGNPVPYLLAVTRFFAAFVSWLLAGAGFWCALLTRDRLTWHDAVSRTRLVRVSNAPLSDASQSNHAAG